jgi:hypothetical protein
MSGQTIDINDLNALRRAGIDALSKALGPVGMARFLHLFDRGVGDYTSEREQWLGDWDLDKIFDEVDRHQKKEEPAP